MSAYSRSQTRVAFSSFGYKFNLIAVLVPNGILYTLGGGGGGGGGGGAGALSVMKRYQ